VAGPWPAPHTWHARGGRLSKAKRRALADLAPRWALPAPPAPLSGDGGPATLAIELGAGTGEAAIALARSATDRLVIATEVHAASVATLLLRAEAAGLANLRAHRGDGRDVLARATAGSVGLVRAFFPDPWPKLRHRHRRLVGLPFVAELVRVLAVGGVVELCTDDAGYAAEMAAALGAEPALRGGVVARADRPCTHYEGLARQGGRTVVDLRFSRIGPAGAS
jgi:tRNA (guanine-N7-)-methyltransferase